MIHPDLRIGTCSWNYFCWVGLVYSRKYRTAAEYLKEYAQKYRTVEVDSFFYRVPSEKDVLNYKGAVTDDFRFTVKAPQDITLTHKRVKDKGSSIQANENFLSVEFYAGFIERITPLSENITAVMLEFEYLRKEKMGSLHLFLKALETFIQQIPRRIPLAIETRNSNYLNEEYFTFLKEHGLIHVFSEKQFLPPITTLYQKYSSYLIDTVIIRLLGGDRTAIEEKTGENWSKIVDEKQEKEAIVKMVQELLFNKKKITLNVNNHYEGCAPLTIAELERIFTKSN